MIVRVYGKINSKELEFTPIEDKPGYWEGYGPRADIYQNIEIYAVNDLGARAHLQCTVFVKEWTPVSVRLIVAPYTVRLLTRSETDRIFLN